MKYRIANWQTFQHYKDRNPLWIKLHISILTSADWVTLNDSGRVLAIACMLVGSKTGGIIDTSPIGSTYIKRVAYLNGSVNFTPLIESGFLVPVADASIPYQMHQNVRPETETETETETEKRRDREEECTETPASSVPEPAPDFVAVFHCDGKPNRWGLTAEALADFKATYKTIDVAHEVDKAQLWCKNNPGRRKTARGMLRFLTAWFSRAVDDPKKPARDAQSDAPRSPSFNGTTDEIRAKEKYWRKNQNLTGPQVEDIFQREKEKRYRARAPAASPVGMAELLAGVNEGNGN